MSTLTSTFPYSGTMPSSQLKKAGLRASLKSVSITAANHVASGLAKVHPYSSEEFDQDHMVAILMGLYFETAMGPLLGTIAIYAYVHWMM